MPTTRLLASVAVCALATASPALGASFDISGAETNPQTLSGVETGRVRSGGSLDVMGTAVSGSDALSIDNAGSIEGNGLSSGAIVMTGTVGSITNSGLLTSSEWTVVRIGSPGVGGVGTFINDTGGRIVGVADTTVVLSGVTGDVVNRGEITNASSDNAVFVRQVTGTFENSGLLEADTGLALSILEGVRASSTAVRCVARASRP